MYVTTQRHDTDVHTESIVSRLLIWVRVMIKVGDITRVLVRVC